MSPGDTVYIKRGRSEVLAVGRITGAYRFDDARTEYKHVRDVVWLRKGTWRLPDDAAFAAKTLTELTEYADFADLLEQLTHDAQIPEAAEPRSVVAAEPYTIDDALQGSSLSAMSS